MPFKEVDPRHNYLIAGGMVNALVYQLNTSETLPQEKKGADIVAKPNVLARNTTGAAQSFAAVMGVQCLSLEATDLDGTVENPGYWVHQSIMYDVVAYDPATHGDKFVVLAEAAPESNMLLTPAWTQGTVKIKIDIKDATHKYAILKNPQPTVTEGQPAQLESAASGTFRIVSQPLNSEGTPATGEQWCTAFFPAASGGAEITLGIVQTANTTAHTLTYKSLALLSDVSQTPNITGIGTVSASIPYVVVR